MPKSALTGTEKKGKKAYLKAGREIAKGKTGPETNANKLMADFNQLYGQAGQMLQPQFQQQGQQAFHEYNTMGAPEVRGEYGANAGQGSRSSALNQALAAAKSNLARQLTNDFNTQQMGLASGMLQQAETGKTNLMNTQAGLAQGQLANAPQYLPKGQSSNRAGGAISGAIQGGIQGFMMGGPWAALGGAVLGGAGGYARAGSDTNYGPAAQGAGDWMKNKFSPVQAATTQIGASNMMGG